MEGGFHPTAAYCILLPFHYPRSSQNTKGISTTPPPAPRSMPNFFISSFGSPPSETHKKSGRFSFHGTGASDFGTLRQLGLVHTYV